MITWRQVYKDIKGGINHIGALVHFVNVKTTISLEKLNDPPTKRPLPSAHHNSDHFNHGLNVLRALRTWFIKRSRRQCHTGDITLS
jgi:hypothetical protein